MRGRVGAEGRGLAARGRTPAKPRSLRRQSQRHCRAACTSTERDNTVNSHFCQSCAARVHSVIVNGSRSQNLHPKPGAAAESGGSSGAARPPAWRGAQLQPLLRAARLQPPADDSSQTRARARMRGGSASASGEKCDEARAPTCIFSKNCGQVMHRLPLHVVSASS